MKDLGSSPMMVIGGLIIVLAALGLACGGGAATDIATSEAPLPVAITTSTPDPKSRPIPKSAGMLGPLTPAEIFGRVSPSIAFVQTPSGSGSGLLIYDGYVVTNAHVVWPYREVRVVFPDGSEFPQAKVINWDLLGDLAVIGIPETEVHPIEMVARENIAIGSELYLIGYLAQDEEFPQPTIVRGILSRLHQWAPIAMTYFQTDVAIAGGQSGGVLLSDDGKVIGISGLKLGEAGFGLVASVKDIQPRIDALISGGDRTRSGLRFLSSVGRFLPSKGNLISDGLTLEHAWDGRAYVFHEPAGTTIDIEVESDADVSFFVLDSIGNGIAKVDNGITGIERASITTAVDGPTFLVIAQKPMEPNDVNVSVSHGFDLIPDEVGHRLNAGSTVTGSIDFPFDFDTYIIDLDEGEVIEVTAESIMIDPFVLIDFPGSRETQVVEDDNSGGGILGLNASIVYRAPMTGQYLVIVYDATPSETGGYFLTVSEWKPRRLQRPLSPLLTTPHELESLPGNHAQYIVDDGQLPL